MTPRTTRNEFYCRACKSGWDDAREPYCLECGSPYRESNYGFEPPPKPDKKETPEQ